MVWVVRATQTNHPNSETGRAVFECAAGRSRSTTSYNVTGLQVRPNLPALPKLFRTSSQAVDPKRSIYVHVLIRPPSPKVPLGGTQSGRSGAVRSLRRRIQILATVFDTTAT